MFFPFIVSALSATPCMIDASHRTALKALSDIAVVAGNHGLTAPIIVAHAPDARYFDHMIIYAILPMRGNTLRLTVTHGAPPIELLTNAEPNDAFVMVIDVISVDMDGQIAFSGDECPVLKATADGHLEAFETAMHW